MLANYNTCLLSREQVDRNIRDFLLSDFLLYFRLDYGPSMASLFNFSSLEPYKRCLRWSLCVCMNIWLVGVLSAEFASRYPNGLNEYKIRKLFYFATLNDEESGLFRLSIHVPTNLS